MANEPMMGFTNLGALVLWALAALSILSIAVVLERALHLWRSATTGHGCAATSRPCCGRAASRTRPARGDLPSFEARIVAAGLDASSAGFTAVEARLEERPSRRASRWSAASWCWRRSGTTRRSSASSARSSA